MWIIAINYTRQSISPLVAIHLQLLSIGIAKALSWLRTYCFIIFNGRPYFPIDNIEVAKLQTWR